MFLFFCFLTSLAILTSAQTIWGCDSQSGRIPIEDTDADYLLTTPAVITNCNAENLGVIFPIGRFVRDHANINDKLSIGVRNVDWTEVAIWFHGEIEDGSDLLETSQETPNVTEFELFSNRKLEIRVENIRLAAAENLAYGAIRFKGIFPMGTDIILTNNELRIDYKNDDSTVGLPIDSALFFFAESALLVSQVPLFMKVPDGATLFSEDPGTILIADNTLSWISDFAPDSSISGVHIAAVLALSLLTIERNSILLKVDTKESGDNDETSRRITPVMLSVAEWSNITLTIEDNTLTSTVTNPATTVLSVTIAGICLEGSTSTAPIAAPLNLVRIIFNNVSAIFEQAHNAMGLDIAAIAVVGFVEFSTFVIEQNIIAIIQQGSQSVPSNNPLVTELTQSGFVKFIEVPILAASLLDINNNVITIDTTNSSDCSFTTYLFKGCSIKSKSTVLITGDKVTKQGLVLSRVNSTELLLLDCDIASGATLAASNNVWLVFVANIADSTVTFIRLYSNILGTINITSTTATLATKASEELEGMPSVPSGNPSFDRLALTFFVIGNAPTAANAIFSGMVSLVSSNLTGTMRGRYMQDCSVIGAQLSKGLILGNEGIISIAQNTIVVNLDNNTVSSGIKDVDRTVAVTNLFGVFIMPIAVGSQGSLRVAQNTIHFSVLVSIVRTIAAITTDSSEVLNGQNELKTAQHTYLHAGGTITLDDNIIWFDLRGTKSDSFAAIPSPSPVRFTTFRRHSISIFGLRMDSTSNLPNANSPTTRATALEITNSKMQFWLHQVEVMLWSQNEKQASLPFWSGIFLPQSSLVGEGALLSIGTSTCSFSMDEIATNTDEPPAAAMFSIPLTYFAGLRVSQKAQFYVYKNLISVDIAFNVMTVLYLDNSSVSCRIFSAVMSSMGFFSFTESLTLESGALVNLVGNGCRINARFPTQEEAEDEVGMATAAYYSSRLPMVEDSLGWVYQNITLRLPSDDTKVRPASSFIIFEALRMSGGSQLVLNDLTVNLTNNIYCAAVVLFNGTSVDIAGESLVAFNGFVINGRFRSVVLFEYNQRELLVTDEAKQTVVLSGNSKFSLMNGFFLLPPVGEYKRADDAAAIVYLRRAKVYLTGIHRPTVATYLISDWRVERNLGAESIEENSFLRSTVGALSVHMLLAENSNITGTQGGSLGATNISVLLNSRIPSPFQVARVVPLYFGLTMDHSMARFYDGSRVWVRGVTVSSHLLTQETVAASIIGVLNGTFDVSPNHPYKVGAVEVSDIQLLIASSQSDIQRPESATDMLPMSMLSVDGPTSNYAGRYTLCNNSINGVPIEGIPAKVTAMRSGPQEANAWGLQLEIAEVCLWNISATPSLSISTTQTQSLEVPIEKESIAMEEVREQSERALTAFLLAGGGVVAATSSGQASVAMAIIRVAKCVESPSAEEGGGEDTDDDGDVDVSVAGLGEPLSPFIHPLGFSVGIGPYRYYIGAIIGDCVIIPIVAFLALRFPLPHALQRWVLPGEPDMPRVLTYVGYPSVLVLPFVTLAEGIAAAATELVRSGRAGETLVGVLGGGLLLGVVGAWAYVLFWRLYRLPIRLEKSPFEGYLSWPFRPAWDWAPEEPSSDSEEEKDDDALSKTNNPPVEDVDEELERMGSVIGGKVFLWVDGVGLVLTVMVGIIEGVGSGVACHSSVISLAILAIIQSLLACTTTCPSEFVIQLLISVCVVMLAASSSVAGIKGAESALFSETAEQTIGFSVNVLGFFGMGLGITCGFVNLANNKEVFATLARILAAGGKGLTVSMRHLRKRRRNGYCTDLKMLKPSTLSEMDKFMGRIQADVERKQLMKSRKEEQEKRENTNNKTERNLSFASKNTSTQESQMSTTSFMNTESAYSHPTRRYASPPRQDEGAVALLRLYETALLDDDDDEAIELSIVTK